MKLRFTPRALQQIQDILSYIQFSSPQGAANVAARLDAIIDLLKEQPRAGRATDRPNVRRLPLSPYPYVLFYRTTDTKVIILRLLHASRKAAAGE